MNYQHPERAGRLAADYTLGLMPVRARRRFERAVAADATLAAVVAAWGERLAPLDEPTDGEMPPARVWRAIEARIESDRQRPVRRWSFALFWRGAAVSAAAACAAIVLFVALGPMKLPGTVEALLDRTGLSGWIEAMPHPPADIGLSTITLGVSERERPRWIRAALLLTNDVETLTVAPPPTR
jgi:hypothetical protein